MMKFLKNYSLLMLLMVMLGSSCVKDNDVPFDAAPVVEFDAATYNANAAGVNYPILTKIPLYGQPVNNADPNLTRTSGSVKFRVNLVGPHRSSPVEVSYQVVAAGTTAVAGTHYTTTGKVTIPANSSFGEVEVIILNPGASTGTRDLVLELTGGADLPPSENEKRIALRISQT